VCVFVGGGGGNPARGQGFLSRHNAVLDVPFLRHARFERQLGNFTAISTVCRCVTWVALLRLKCHAVLTLYHPERMLKKHLLKVSFTASIELLRLIIV
jgi:hypothetical protein